MKFNLEPGAHGNLIRGYSDTELRIGERRVGRSCILSAERLITDWEPAAFADLTPAHLETVFALAPELVLLATGPTQRFATGEVHAAFARQRIGVEVMQLGAACRTFNVLVQEGRRVVAALFLR